MSLLPARMINEVVYCPRLFALEHVDGEWAESADTVRGRTVHRRVDHGVPGVLPDPDQEDPPPSIQRSVTLSDETLGIIAKLDLAEIADGQVVPVDYKKGRIPPVAEGAYLPERVQVCAQALLLRAHGYEVPYGEIYFAGSKRRVRVDLDEALIAATLEAVATARGIVESGQLPPPLLDSPKCYGCSLVGICLPDETNVLTARSERVRTVAPGIERGLPLYIVARGAKIAIRADEIVVSVKGAADERVRLTDTSRVIVAGAASVTTPALTQLAERGIPFAVHGWGGRLLGQFVPSGGHNVLGRIAQHQVAADPAASLLLARAFVRGKIANQRVLLRRNGSDVPPDTLNRLKSFVGDTERSESVESLYGTEGMAARLYFESFARMLKGDALTFEVSGRNRRPPRDPINALLSFVYACLTRECANVLQGIGLDAWVGFLHRPRPGKPALALDLMEEFRPLIGDSVVVGVVNNGVVQETDFIVHAAGCSLQDAARKRVVRAFERRLAEEVQHPRFGTRMSYRRILEVQARILAKALRGDIPAYEPFVTR